MENKELIRYIKKIRIMGTSKTNPEEERALCEIIKILEERDDENESRDH